jgi:branched-chain amino acid transport system permease protein
MIRRLPLRTLDGRWRPSVGVIASLVVAVVLAALAGGFSEYNLDVMTSILALVVLAVAWNLLGGFGGLFSLGASAFVGTGAYASALIEIHAGVGYPVALVIGILAGLVLAAILALPLLRLRGDYFTIGTIAAALAIQAWALNSGLTGGSSGLNFPISGLPSPQAIYQLSCVAAGVALAVSFAIAHSGFGMRMKAVRDDEGAATALGVSAQRYRFSALVINGALSGLAGTLIGMQQVSFEPNGMLGISWSANALLMAIVGGVGTVIGPVLGVVVVYYALTLQLQSYQELSQVIEGVLLMVIVVFAPGGLWPAILRLWSWLLTQLRKRRAGTASPVDQQPVPAREPTSTAT